MGYELNVQLRVGERLTRNWFNKGLHVNMLEGGDQSLTKDASRLGMCRQLTACGSRAREASLSRLPRRGK